MNIYYVCRPKNDSVVVSRKEVSADDSRLSTGWKKPAAFALQTLQHLNSCSSIQWNFINTDASDPSQPKNPRNVKELAKLVYQKYQVKEQKALSESRLARIWNRISLIFAQLFNKPTMSQQIQSLFDSIQAKSYKETLTANRQQEIDSKQQEIDSQKAHEDKLKAYDAEIDNIRNSPSIKQQELDNQLKNIMSEKAKITDQMAAIIRQNTREIKAETKITMELYLQQPDPASPGKMEELQREIENIHERKKNYALAIQKLEAEVAPYDSRIQELQSQMEKLYVDQKKQLNELFKRKQETIHAFYEERKSQIQQKANKKIESSNQKIAHLQRQAYEIQEQSNRAVGFLNEVNRTLSYRIVF